jgi:hypothetical protein
MPFAHLLIERDETVVTLTINRPDRLNALNGAAIDELRQALLELRRDDGVRAVVVTGAGEKAFVAGADIAELAGLTPVTAKRLAERGQHVFDLVETLGKPVVAAINGFALAAAASWRSRARCAWHPIVRASGSPRSISDSCRATAARSGCRASSAEAVRSSCCCGGIRSTPPRPIALASWIAWCRPRR